MNKQEQINRVTKALEEIGLMFAHSVATLLVNKYKIGDKDRFEINYTVINGTSAKDTETIEPINYKEE